jgi:hypothetical protein
MIPTKIATATVKKPVKKPVNYMLYAAVALIVLMAGYFIYQSMNGPRVSSMTAFGNRLRRIVGRRR